MEKENGKFFLEQKYGVWGNKSHDWGHLRPLDVLLKKTLNGSFLPAVNVQFSANGTLLVDLTLIPVLIIHSDFYFSV